MSQQVRCPMTKPSNSLLAVLVFAVVLVLQAQEVNSPTGHVESAAAVQLRALNNKLLHIHGQMQQLAPGQWRPFRDEAAPVITQRFQALSAMIQQNTGLALSFAFSPDLAGDLALKFPGSSSSLETNG